MEKKMWNNKVIPSPICVRFMDYLEGPHEIFHFNITQLIMHYRPIKYEDITLNKHNEVFSGPSPGSIIRNRRDE